jgi:hypothetical protein
MRWCVVVYSQVDEKYAHAIVMQSIMHAIECVNYANTREVQYTGLLDYITSLMNFELIKFKEIDNINFFQGIGIALTVVDSVSRMAYAQGGDVLVLLCHDKYKRAKFPLGIRAYHEYNLLEMMHAQRNFGTY